VQGNLRRIILAMGAGELQWWSLTNLLQGAVGEVVGSVVGIVGVFWAFQLTRNHELNLYEIARREQEHLASRERVLAGAANVVQACVSLRGSMAQGTGSQNDVDRAQALAKELMVFSLREISDRPHTAAWALEHSFNISEWAVVGSDLLVVKIMSDQIAGSLIGWVDAGCHEGALNKDGVAEDWSRTIDDINETR
jgi:hypothetical protein